MNRRNFLKGLVTAAAGFTILPGAGRIWKAEARLVAVPNPDWVNAPYEMHFWFSDPVWSGPFPDRAGECIEGPKFKYKRLPIRFNHPVDLTEADGLYKHAIPPTIFKRVVDPGSQWK